MSRQLLSRLLQTACVGLQAGQRLPAAMALKTSAALFMQPQQQPLSIMAAFWPASGLIGMQQLRGMACSAGLGRAPPKVINIEYDPEDLEAFIQVADAIEEAFPTVVVRGNEEKGGRPGSFEVETEEGVSIFSRLAAKQLPGPQDVLRRIAASMVVPSPDAENKPFCA